MDLPGGVKPHGYLDAHGSTVVQSTGCLFCFSKLDLLLPGSVDQATTGALPFRLIPGILRMFEGIDR